MFIAVVSVLFISTMVFIMDKLFKLSLYLTILLNVLILSFKMNYKINSRHAQYQTRLQTSTESIKTKKNWVDCQGNNDVDPTSTNSFKLVTYNVLGPVHGESSKHNYAPVHITKWTRRRDKLIEELKSISSDILCLQEVSYKSLKETFIPGLRSVKLQLTAFAPSKLADKSRHIHGHKQIGCAIFTHESKFKVLGMKTIFLRDFAGIDHSVSANFKYDVKAKHNSMAMVCLQLNTTNQIFIVANTHLFWDPNRADIKTVQTAAIVKALSYFSKVMVDTLKRNQTHAKSLMKSSSTTATATTAIASAGTAASSATVDTELSDDIPESFPMFLTGDFNTFLEVESVVSDSGFLPSSLPALLTAGHLDKSHPQHPDAWVLKRNEYLAKDAWGQRNDPDINPRLGDLSMPEDSSLRFQNVYTSEEFAPFRPLFSTKTDDFQGWIDHVWVNKHIQIQYVLKPPVLAQDFDASIQARVFEPIPNQNFPSDHIPLGVIAIII